MPGILSDGVSQHGTWTDPGAPANEGVIKASPCTGMFLRITNSSATLVYCQLFNTTTVPADGASPYLGQCYPVPANTTLVILLGRLVFSTGCTWASSSTIPTKTVTALVPAPLQVSVEVVA